MSTHKHIWQQWNKSFSFHLVCSGEECLLLRRVANLAVTMIYSIVLVVQRRSFARLVILSWTGFMKIILNFVEQLAPFYRQLSSRFMQKLYPLKLELFCYGEVSGSFRVRVSQHLTKKASNTYWRYSLHLWTSRLSSSTTFNLMGLYRDNPLAPQARAFNKARSEVTVSVEWILSDIGWRFKFIDYKNMYQTWNGYSR